MGSLSLVVLSGCSSESETNTAEFNQIATDIEEHTNEAENKMETGNQNAERENWGRCGADYAGAADEIEEAKQATRDALRRAESGNHLDAADALDRLLQLFDPLEKGISDLRDFCDAMSNGNTEEARSYRQSAQQHIKEYQENREDVNEALDELDN